MATVTGEIVPLNRLDPLFHAVNSSVVVRQGRKVLGHGIVTDNDEFTIEISDDVRGEIEITLGLYNAAPSIAQADGGDIFVTLLYSNVNNFIA